MSLEELKKLADEGKIKSVQVELLARLTPGTVVSHKSWGIGRVKELDAVFGRLIVDFPSKEGHSFELAFAAQSLEPLAADHITSRKTSDLAAVQTLAKEKPLDLLRIVLSSHGGRTTAEEIATDLCGSVIAEADWKSWWSATQRAAKKDGHFAIPAKKSEPITLREAAQTHADTLVDTFHAKHGLKEKIHLAEQWHDEQSPFDPTNPIAREMAAAIAELLERHPPRHVAIALEAIWLLVDFKSASPLSAEALAARERNALTSARDLAALADELRPSKFDRLLLLVRLADANWAERLLSLTNETDVSTKRVDEIMEFLLAENSSSSAQKYFARCVRDLTAKSELLHWLARNRACESFREVVAPLLGPRFLTAMLAAIESDAIDSPLRKRHGLREFLISDETLLRELLANVNEEDARQIGERLLRSGQLDEPTKRSIMGKIIKIYPALQALVAATASQKNEPLYVSAESLARKQAEYENLIDKEIPENARQIGIARSYGDLRENFEFKSAKEQQRLLQAQKIQMEQELSRAQRTNFDTATGDAVAIGTRVAISDEGGAEREYIILGAWDSDLASGIISYLTPIAKALMNKRVGDEAEVEVEGARHRVRIIRIAPWRAATPANV